MILLQNTMALIVTLGLLVTIHEFGHFLVARHFGVHVLRFSIGFGQPLWTWRDRHDTEFAIAWIPLGGYVKMLDEREGPVPESQLDETFNRKSVGQRSAIAFAGPAANFLFALLAYWALQWAGETVTLPVLGSAEPESPAARANLPSGYEIRAIDGESVRSWPEIGLALADRIGDSGSIRFDLWPVPQVLDPPESALRAESAESALRAESAEGVNALATGAVEAQSGIAREIPIDRWLAESDEPRLFEALGIVPWRPQIAPIVDEVEIGSPAAEAGIQSGDRILSVNGGAVDDWQALSDILRRSPDERLLLTLERDSKQLDVHLVPARKQVDAGSIGYAGIRVLAPDWPDWMQRHHALSPIAAIPAAFDQTIETGERILLSLKKLLVGAVSVENLGGPLTIAKAAGSSAEYGLDTFVRFLAQLSVMLGVLNLLPIPVLDGGHLLFYAAEALRGRPLSAAVQLLALRVGVALLVAIMGLALFNDFMRLV